MRGFNSTLTMLDGKPDGGENAGDEYREKRPKGGGGFRNDLDDEIPFAPEVR